MDRTMSNTTLCILTLIFDQWPWIKDVTLPWSSITILWNIIPIHAFSENLWPGQCLNHYEYSDLDLWSRSWHFLGSSVTILWNIIPIHAFSEKLWPGQCLSHHEHSDFDLWLITMDQDHGTSLGPGQQSCEILFKFIKRVRSYGSYKLFANF